MPRDPYFSFGDEDLDGTPDESLPRLDGGGPAVGIAERAADAGRAADEGDRQSEDGADPGAPRRRPLSPVWPRLIAPLALALMVALSVKVFLQAGGTGASPVFSGAPASPQPSVEGSTSAGERSAAERLAGRRRAAERERAQRQRAQTRRRARRHRQRRRAERRRLAERRSRRAAVADIPEAPATSYPSPTYIPPSEPAPQPAPESQQPRGVQDGSHSPEFGL